MTNTPPIMRYFESAHLPPHLAAVSGSVRELAEYMLDHTDPGPEQTTGLRKLLEAKDAFVRAALDRAPVMAQERSRVSTTGSEPAGPPEAPQAPLRAPQQYRCDECGRTDLPTFHQTGGGAICARCISRDEPEVYEPMLFDHVRHNDTGERGRVQWLSQALGDQTVGVRWARGGVIEEVAPDHLTLIARSTGLEQERN